MLYRRNIRPKRQPQSKAGTTPNFNRRPVNQKKNCRNKPQKTQITFYRRSFASNKLREILFIFLPLLILKKQFSQKEAIKKSVWHFRF